MSDVYDPSRKSSSSKAAAFAPSPFGGGALTVGEGEFSPEASVGRRTDRAGSLFQNKGRRAKELRQNATPAEKRFWELVRAERLDGLKFRRQHQIGPFIVDFCCLPSKIVVELLGSAHDSADAKAYDASRTKFLQEAGFRVIEFSNEEVLGDPRSVEATLKAFLSTPVAAPPPQGEDESSAAEELLMIPEGSQTALETKATLPQ